MEAFKKFDEFDLVYRKYAIKEKETRVEGRLKFISNNEEYLAKAPAWAKM